MAERSKAAVLKTVSGVTHSGVRIPLPPPPNRQHAGIRVGRKTSDSTDFPNDNFPLTAIPRSGHTSYRAAATGGGPEYRPAASPGGVITLLIKHETRYMPAGL